MPAYPAVGYDITVNRGANLVPVIQPASDLASGFLEEDSDSPQIEFGEQATFTHSFTGDWATCVSHIVTRGTFVNDSFGNVFRVLSCALRHMKGNIGKLTISTESISFAVPPDEFDCETVEFNPAIEKNPRYAGTVAAPILSYNDFQQIHSAVDLPTDFSRTEAESQLANTSNPPLAAELLQKLRRGEETYYLAGLKITWSTFSWAPQAKDQGGYIQSPTVILPTQFYISAAGTTTLPEDWDWLRVADSESFSRTWFRHSRSWLGAPNGHWDTDIYQT